MPFLDLLEEFDSRDPLWRELEVEVALLLRRRFGNDHGNTLLLKTALGVAKENYDASCHGGSIYFDPKPDGIRGQFSRRRLEHCHSDHIPEHIRDHILNALNDAILEIAIAEWSDESQSGFATAWIVLRDYTLPVALLYFQDTLGISPGRAEPLAENAFDLTIEELDLIVCGGKNLTVPCSNGCAEGQLTSRRLGLRKRLSWAEEDDSPVWRGAIEFKAFTRNIITKRCIDILRKNYQQAHSRVNEGAKLEDSPSSLEHLTDSFYQHIEAKQAEYTSTADELIRFSTYLSGLNQKAGSETASLLAQFYNLLSGKIAEILDSPHNSELLLSMWDSALPPDAAKWEFVRSALTLSDSLFYKRKSRFLNMVRDPNHEFKFPPKYLI